MRTVEARAISKRERWLMEIRISGFREPGLGIFRPALVAHLEVDARSVGPGGVGPSDHGSGGDILSVGHREVGELAVERVVLAAVIDDDQQSVAPEAVRE